MTVHNAGVQILAYACRISACCLLLYSPATHCLSIISTQRAYLLSDCRLYLCTVFVPLSRLVAASALGSCEGLQRQGQGDWVATSGNRQNVSRNSIEKKKSHWYGTGMGNRLSYFRAFFSVGSLITSGQFAKWLRWFPPELLSAHFWATQISEQV